MCRNGALDSLFLGNGFHLCRRRLPCPHLVLVALPGTTFAHLVYFVLLKASFLDAV